VGCTTQELLDDQSLKGLFNLALGIGKKSNIDHELLEHLSDCTANDSNQTKSEKCQITTDPGEILEVINGGCFEGLSSTGMTSVSFEAIYEFESESGCEMQFVALNIFDKQYMTESDVNSYIYNLEKKHSNQLIAKHLNNEHVVIQPVNLPESTNLLQSKKIHFIIAIDKSASMSDQTTPYKFNNFDFNHIESNTFDYKKPNTPGIKIQKLSLTDNLDPNKIKKEPKYIKVQFGKISYMTHTTNIFLKGNLKHLIVKYTDSNKNQHVEPIDVISTSENNIKHDHNTLNMLNILQTYIDILEQINLTNNMIQSEIQTQSFIEQKIQDLYTNNLDFLHKININVDQSDTLSVNLINQAKSLWQILTTKYVKIIRKHSDLFKSEYDNCVNLGSIMRSVSDKESSCASNRMTHIRQQTQYDNLCRLCFSSNIDCVFQSCSHAGLCLKCVIKINDTANSTFEKVKLSGYKCPFCHLISTNMHNIDLNIDLNIDISCGV
jgi:hypothetical protein